MRFQFIYKLILYIITFTTRAYKTFGFIKLIKWHDYDVLALIADYRKGAIFYICSYVFHKKSSLGFYYFNKK